MLPKTRFAFMIFLAICTPGLAVAPPGVNLAAAAPEDVALFQDVLARHGQWLNYGQHGQVWRPAQVNRNWRPYTNGRWVPSQEGYVFETDEPWGWATYHYGNWLPTNEHGWVWVPGRTWYPHTVNWRSNDENVGWAPVPPPEYTGSDNYSSGGYSDGGYGYSPDLNSYGSALISSLWIFTPVQFFLLGWGQPYSSIYSYTNACVLASPQYIPTVYRSTVYINNYVSPSYAPNAYYNWGPPVTYITRVTNIKNIDIERRCKDIRLDQLRNVVPPANLRHRHAAWREVWPAAAANREIQVRPVPHHKIASSRLNRPDAVPAPSSLPRRQADASAPHGLTSRPLPQERQQASSSRTLPGPDNRKAWQPPLDSPRATQPPERPRGHISTRPDESGVTDRETAVKHAPLLKHPPNPTTAPGDQNVRQQTPATPPPHRYQTQPGQPIEPTAAPENQVRPQQAQRLQQNQQHTEQDLRQRQQQRLEMEKRQQEARSHQIPAPQQVRSQPQVPLAQPPRQPEMVHQQQMQQRQAELQRQQQAQQQQRQAEMMRQQQMQQQAEMQRQQQMQQQRQAELQRQQQAQQQRQAEMMRARQVQQQQQQQMVRQSPPPPPPPPPPQKKQDNQRQP